METIEKIQAILNDSMKGEVDMENIFTIFAIFF